MYVCMLVNFASEKQVLIVREVVVYSLNMVKKFFFFSISLSRSTRHVLICISLCLLDVDYGSARPEIPTIIVIT